MAKQRYSVTISDQELAVFVSNMQVKEFIARELAAQLVEKMTVEVTVSIQEDE